MIYMKPMTQSKFDQYSQCSVADYAEDLIKSGIETKENAYLEANKEFAAILPDGMQTAGNYLYAIVNEQDEELGLIWYGRDFEKKDGAYVFDFLINAEHRRKGYGRTALTLIEEQAKEKGFNKMGLNVFKFNTAAYAFYQKAGYVTEKEFDGNMIMFKQL